MTCDHSENGRSVFTSTVALSYPRDHLEHQVAWSRPSRAQRIRLDDGTKLCSGDKYYHNLEW
jgi:hypothetical protein